MATAVQVSNEYRNVPVTALVESTSNPRKRFDTKSLEELAASFKAQGVLQPLLVRAIEEDKYEVIAGARRLRAANIAALEEVPVRVIELSDAACVETQLVENIQRENVHPLEEAFAFYGLLHTDGLQYDINSLATRAGKSPAFVATRLRLVELTPSIAEAFLADEIGVGHALEIAKLPQAEQQRAFDAAFHTVWNGGKETRILRPVRDLTAWIEQNILLSLDCRAVRQERRRRLCRKREAARIARSAPALTPYFSMRPCKTVAPIRIATTTSSRRMSSVRSPRNPTWCRLQTNGKRPETAQCLDGTNTSP